MIVLISLLPLIIFLSFYNVDALGNVLLLADACVSVYLTHISMCVIDMSVEAAKSLGEGNYLPKSAKKSKSVSRSRVAKHPESSQYGTTGSDRSFVGYAADRKTT